MKSLSLYNIHIYFITLNNLWKKKSVLEDIYLNWAIVVSSAKHRLGQHGMLPNNNYHNGKR